MQRDLKREKKPQLVATVTANVNRLRKNIPMPGMRASSGATGSAGATVRSVVAQVKQEEIQNAGPSRVLFSEPNQDDEAKGRRACEGLLVFPEIFLTLFFIDRYMFEKQTERSESTSLSAPIVCD
jgi:DNA polymerase alpha subunit B